jgi:di/tricarboxylate transporter
MRSRHYIPFILASVLLCGILFPFTIRAVETKYDLLTPLPSTTGGAPQTQADTSDPIAYIRMLYQLLISLAVVVAVFMIVLGGIRRMTAGGNEASVKAAKTMINQALLGLLLLTTAYLILYTINPNLLKLDAIFKDEIQKK